MIANTNLTGRTALALALLAFSATAQLRTPFRDGSAASLPPQPPAVASQALTQGQVPQTGQVVINEFMKDPAAVVDTRGEWIELWNAMPWRVNLQGWSLSDDAGSMHVISAPGGALRLRPGGYLVLGNQADMTLNGGVALDYQYSSFVLGNGADQIVLKRADGLVVDRVDYDDGILWPDLPGRSISLSVAGRDAVNNDDPAWWCHSVTPISASNADTGTPGYANDACP